MKIAVTLFYSLVFLCSFGYSQESSNYLNESSKDIDSRMEWFADSKYGLFIHFGLYSQLGGEWKGKSIDHYAEWIQANADIPAQEYAMLDYI